MSPNLLVMSSGAPDGVIRRVLLLAVLFVVFLGAIDGLGDGFQGLGSGLLDRFFAASANPLVGLIVGMLATTLVQSSSVTSALIVALVAAPESPLPFASAIPMVMGANLGTTVTNTLASLGHLRDRDELGRAFAVATCHDLFNLVAVAILLPVEIATGVLARSAAVVSGWFGGFVGRGVDYDSPLKGLIEWVPRILGGAADRLTGSETQASAILAFASAVVLVLTLGLLVRTLKGLTTTGAEGAIRRVLGRSAVLAMGVGAVATVLAQSSSVTTSMLVPLAGAGLLALDDAFPVTLGANVGTTVTAFLAALAVSGPNAHFGFEIATVHLLFNVIGIALVYPVRPIRNIPLAGARFLARVAIRSRAAALGYVVLVFYGAPALLLLLGRALGY